MNARNLTLALLATALMLPLAACSASSPDSDGALPDAARSVEDLGGQAYGSAAMSESADSMDGGMDTASAEASVIQTGWISISLDSPADAADRVTEVAKQLGGYAENVSVDGGDRYSTADVSIRVPADRFDEAFTKLEEIGEVTGKGRSATDVTAQHVDLQARVAALEESVKRLTELMKDADSTSDLLEAESALSERQQELDGLRAQLDALEDQVGYATIQVSLYSESTIPGGPANFWEGLVTGLKSIATAASGALIVIGVLLPWLLLIGALALVVVALVRAARKRRRARLTAAAAPVPTVLTETATTTDEVAPELKE